VLLITDSVIVNPPIVPPEAVRLENVADPSLLSLHFPLEALR